MLLFSIPSIILVWVFANSYFNGSFDEMALVRAGKIKGILLVLLFLFSCGYVSVFITEGLRLKNEVGNAVGFFASIAIHWFAIHSLQHSHDLHQLKREKREKEK